MTTYVIRRTLRAIVLLVLVSILAFVLFTVLPDASPAQPAPGFVAFIKQTFLHFNLGYSDRNQQSVLSLIVGRLPATLSLLVGAALLAAVLGIPLGIITATSPGRRIDRDVMRAALTIVSMPVFWLGLIALYLFASDIGKIPILPGGGSYMGLTADPGRWFTSMILPWLVLAAAEAAIYARLLRGQMLDVMDEEFVRGARARGVPQQRVVWRHGAVAAIPAGAPVAGVEIGALIGAAVLIETAFRIPGIGLLGYDAVVHADFPTVQGIVLFAGMLIVVVNLIVDIAHAFIDPRVCLA
jgi:peptide/nickel transport system permease protein